LPNQISYRFSRAASSYDGHANVQKIAAAQVAKLVHTHISKNASVVDVGCGTGVLGRLLPDYRLIQVDYAEGMCQEAMRLSAVKGDVVCADATTLPFGNHTVEAYISSLCWQWVTPALAAINEMQRVLMPEAVGIIATLTEGTFSELEQSFSTLCLPKRLLTFMPEQPMTAWMHSAGLSVRHYETQRKIIYYQCASDFFRHQRGIGATMVKDKRALQRGELQTLIRHYDTHFTTEEGIPVTYHIGYWVVQNG
jgi:malonyl-CoA O-methyltransferase